RQDAALHEIPEGKPERSHLRRGDDRAHAPASTARPVVLAHEPRANRRRNETEPERRFRDAVVRQIAKIALGTAALVHEVLRPQGVWPTCDGMFAASAGRLKAGLERRRSAPTRRASD